VSLPIISSKYHLELEQHAKMDEYEWGSGLPKREKVDKKTPEMKAKMLLEHFGQVAVDPNANPWQSFLVLPNDTDLNIMPPHPFNNAPIYIVIDFETGCDKMGQGPVDEEQDFLTECGLSSFDIRDVQNREIVPGDRGFNYFRYIKSRHIIFSDNPHNPHDPNQLVPLGNKPCNHRKYHPGYCQSKENGAKKFVFGKSIFKTTGPDCDRYVREWLLNLKKTNLRPGEQSRQLILVAWDLHMEHKNLPQLDLADYDRYFDCFIDLQKFLLPLSFARRLKKPACKLVEFLEVMGINFNQNSTDPKDEPLLHNGGNDAAFEMQALIACVHTLDRQADIVDSRNGSLPLLGRTWTTHAVSKLNLTL